MKGGGSGSRRNVPPRARRTAWACRRTHLPSTMIPVPSGAQGGTGPTPRRRTDQRQVEHQVAESPGGTPSPRPPSRSRRCRPGNASPATRGTPPPQAASGGSSTPNRQGHRRPVEVARRVQRTRPRRLEVQTRPGEHASGSARPAGGRRSPPNHGAANTSKPRDAVEERTERLVLAEIMPDSNGSVPRCGSRDPGTAARASRNRSISAVRMEVSWRQPHRSMPTGPRAGARTGPGRGPQGPIVAPRVSATSRTPPGSSRPTRGSIRTRQVRPDPGHQQDAEHHEHPTAEAHDEGVVLLDPRPCPRPPGV